MFENIYFSLSLNEDGLHIIDVILCWVENWLIAG